MKIHELATEFAEIARVSPDLVQPKYGGEKGSLRGHCYVLTEALWYERGKATGWKPTYLNSKTWPEGLMPGETHWYLMRTFGHDNITFHEVCDPTAEQFDINIPHHKGKSCGFQTKEPSKRTKSLIARVKYIRVMKNIEVHVWESVDNRETKK